MCATARSARTQRGPPMASSLAADILMTLDGDRASPLTAFLSQAAGLASVGSQMLIFRVSGIRNRHTMKQTAGTTIG